MAEWPTGTLVGKGVSELGVSDRGLPLFFPFWFTNTYQFPLCGGGWREALRAHFQAGSMSRNCGNYSDAFDSCTSLVLLPLEQIAQQRGLCSSDCMPCLAQLPHAQKPCVGRIRRHVCTTSLAMQPIIISVGQCVSTFLMLQPFNTVLHALVSPTIKLFFVASS